MSLVIELMFTKAGRPQWDVKQIIKSLPTEEPVQNPVVYRVRVIAMTCQAMLAEAKAKNQSDVLPRAQGALEVAEGPRA